VDPGQPAQPHHQAGAETAGGHPGRERRRGAAGALGAATARAARFGNREPDRRQFEDLAAPGRTGRGFRRQGAVTVCTVGGLVVVADLHPFGWEQEAAAPPAPALGAGFALPAGAVWVGLATQGASEEGR